MDSHEQIDNLIASLPDGRGAILAIIRAMIHEADPAIVEEVKWRGAPTWSHDGIVCVGNAYKGKVKLTFPQGANLPDPSGLFNAGLSGNQWRSIDIRIGETLDSEAFKDLIRRAVAQNGK